jgi:hypothetical protein
LIGNDATPNVSQQYWINRLTNAGLPQDLAEKIVTLNELQFTILTENDTAELDAELNQLVKLVQHPGVWNTVKQYPELAGLYVATLRFDAKGPEKLDKIFRNGEYYQFFKNYCHTHTLDIESCLDAAEQYEKNGDLIVKLYNTGHDFPAPETYFDMNPRTDDAKDAFNKFRRDFILDALDNDTGEEQEGKLQYIYLDSFDLVNKLDGDVELNKGFLDTYFPAMLRACDAKKDDITIMLNTPYIYEVFMKPQGENLFKMYGNNVVQQLKQFQGKPELLEKYVVENLLQRNSEIVYALDRFKDEPELLHLLGRDIPENDKIKILEEQAFNPNALNRLKYYESLSNSVILDDLHPYEGWMTNIPCYYTYLVIKKTINGQGCSVLEITFAILDPVLIVTEIALIPVTGGGAVIAIEAGKHLTIAAVKVVATRVAWQAAKQASKQMLKQGIKFAGKQAIKQEVKMAMRTTAEKTLQNAGKQFGKIDITGFVENTFDKSRMFGIKNDTFKKMSGLDARIFMRGDRKVVLNLNNLKNVPMVAIPVSVISDTATGIGGEEVMKTDMAQQFILTVKNKVTNILEPKPLSYEQYQSALWLNAATGKLDKLATEAVQHNVP